MGTHPYRRLRLHGDGTDATADATLGLNDELTVEVNGITYTAGDGDLTHDGVANTWELEIPPINVLTNGDFPVVATVTSLVDSSSVSGGNTLNIDLIDPAAPVVDSLPDFTTATPTITGSATLAAGDVLTVEVDGVTYRVGDGNLTHDDGANTWSLAIPSGNALPNDTYSVQAIVEDAAGNSGTDSEDITVAVDLKIIAPLVFEQVTSDLTPVITGLATVGGGDSFRVEIGTALDPDANGSYELGIDGALAHDGANDTWTLSVPFGGLLPAGTDYQVTATVTDSEGSSISRAGIVTIDANDPAVPVIDPLLSNELRTPEITGEAELDIGEELEVQINGVTYNATRNKSVGPLVHSAVDNTWSLRIPASDALDNGFYPVVATVTAQNDATRSVQRNIIINLLTNPSADFDISNTQTPTITGSAAIDTSGELIGLTITDAGEGYTSIPTVSITGGGATEDATVDAITDTIVGSVVTVVDGGSGYVTAPTVTIIGGGATLSATATAEINRFVDSITVDNGGSGYTTAPTVTISGGGSDSRCHDRRRRH